MFYHLSSVINQPNHQLPEMFAWTSVYHHPKSLVGSDFLPIPTTPNSVSSGMEVHLANVASRANHHYHHPSSFLIFAQSFLCCPIDLILSRLVLVLFCYFLCYRFSCRIHPVLAYIFHLRRFDKIERCIGRCPWFHSELRVHTSFTLKQF